MNQKALRIFDKDGTLVTTKSGDKYPKLGDQKLIEPVAIKVSEFHFRGDIIAVATNQGGVKFGFKSIDSVYEECEELMVMLPQVSIVLFCPDDGENCHGVLRFNGKLKRIWYTKSNEIADECEGLIGSFRKPGRGMLELLRRLYVVPQNNTYYYGDMESDKQAAISAGVSYVDVKELLEVENG